MDKQMKQIDERLTAIEKKLDGDVIVRLDQLLEVLQGKEEKPKAQAKTK